MLPVLNIFCFRLFSGSLPLLPRLLVTCILTPLQIFRSTRCFRMQFLCKLCIFCFRLFSGSLPLLPRPPVTCILPPSPKSFVQQGVSEGSSYASCVSFASGYSVVAYLFSLVFPSLVFQTPQNLSFIKVFQNAVPTQVVYLLFQVIQW